MNSSTRAALIALTVVIGVGACGSTKTGTDAANGTAGGRGGAGDAGGGQATDGASDQLSCTALCGRTERALRAAGNCMYVVGCPLVGDFTGLAVLVDGQAVPRDASRTEGWDYTDASMSAFELFGQVCMDVLNTGASVDVSYLCELP